MVLPSSREVQSVTGSERQRVGNKAEDGTQDGGGGDGESSRVFL